MGKVYIIKRSTVYRKAGSLFSLIGVLLKLTPRVIGDKRCRFTNISAINAVISLKNWFCHLIVRKDLPVPLAGTRIRAGSCLVFPVDHPLDQRVWGAGCPRPAPLPLAASHERLSSTQPCAV